MKVLIEKNGQTLGFIYQDALGHFWYVLGSPNQPTYQSAKCNSVQEGFQRINNAVTQ